MALKDWTSQMVAQEQEPTVFFPMDGGAQVAPSPVEAVIAQAAQPVEVQQAPAQQIDGKQAVDMATNTGIMQGLNDAEYQKLAQQYAANEAKIKELDQQLLQTGLLGPTPQEQAMYQADLTNRYLTDLVGLKQGYKNAQFNQDQAGMFNASVAGQKLREQGRAAGIDPALLSEDLTLDQARDIQRQLEWQSAFGGGMSADDYYSLQYRRYRDSGLSWRRAQDRAGADAARYQANQAARMSKALMKYGLDDSGVLTRDGMAGLMQMAWNGGEQGERLANFLINYLPGAKDAYALNSQRTLMGDKNNYAQSNMRLGGEIDMKKAEHKHALDEDTANNDVARYIQKKQAEAGIENLSIQDKARVRAGIVAPLIESGQITKEDGINYILTGSIGKNKSAGSTQEKEPPRATVGVLQQLGDMLDRAQKDIQSGDIYNQPTDEGSISAFCNAAEKAIADGHVKGEDVTTLRNYENMLQYLLAMNSPDGPDTEWASQAYNNMTDDFKEKNAEAFASVKPKAAEEKAEETKPSGWEKREKPNIMGFGGKF